MSLIGKSIGNYQIKAKLGEGGMGTVYLGEHPLIGKRVAVKVLLEELSSKEDIVSRFFNEAKAVNVIDHPVRDKQGQLIAVVGVSHEVRKAADKHPIAEVANEASPKLSLAALTKTDGSPLRGAALALTLYFAGVGSRVLLDQFIPGQLPFITYFPVVALSAILSGFWPTLGLLMASALTTVFWPPLIELETRPQENLTG